VKSRIASKSANTGSALFKRLLPASRCPYSFATNDVVSFRPAGADKGRTSGAVANILEKRVGGDALVLASRDGGMRAGLAASARRLFFALLRRCVEHAGIWRVRAIAANDIPALADALETLLDTLPGRRIHLVGHSMGGMVAQEFLRRRAHRASSICLYCKRVPAWPSPRRPEALQEARERAREFMVRRIGPLDAGKTMRDMAESLLDQLLSLRAPEAARAAANRIDQLRSARRLSRRDALHPLVRRHRNRAEDRSAHTGHRGRRGPHDCTGDRRGHGRDKSQVPDSEIIPRVAISPIWRTRRPSIAFV